MKCPNCLKEFNGSTCPYCGEKVVEEEIKINKKMNKTLVIMIIISIALVLVSFAIPFISILGICSCLVTLYLSIKETELKQKAVSISALIGIIGLISFLSFLNPYFDKWFSSYKLENVLNIDLPNKSAIEYKYDSGFRNNNISYVYYKYELSKEEYDKLINDNRINEKDEFDWFISNVSDKDYSYIIYDYNNDIYSDERLNKLDYRYIFVQVGNEEGRYYAYIYKVARRKY